jgi:hypothetical protein
VQSSEWRGEDGGVAVAVKLRVVELQVTDLELGARVAAGVNLCDQIAEAKEREDRVGRDLDAMVAGESGASVLYQMKLARRADQGQS